MDFSPEEQRSLVNAFQWIFLGGLAATALYGATVVQAWIYSQRNSDPWPLKSFIYAVVAADSATEALIVLALYDYFVKNFGNFGAFVATDVPLSAEIPFTTVITWIVQLGIIWQAYGIRWGPRSPTVRRLIVPALLASFILSTIAMVLNCAVTAILATQRVSQGDPVLQSDFLYFAGGLSQALAAVVDIVLTAVLCLELRSSLSQHEPSRGVLYTLMLYLINRGVLVVGCQMLFTFFWFVDNASFKWNFFHLVLSKLYVNTMLAMYNGRPVLRSRSQSTSTSRNLALSPVDGKHTFSTGAMTYSTQPVIQLNGLSPDSSRTQQLPSPSMTAVSSQPPGRPLPLPFAESSPLRAPLRVQTM